MSGLRDFEKLLGDIINLSDSVRFVFVTNEEGRVVHSRISSKAFMLGKDQVSVLGVDLQILRKILRLYDDLIGQSTSLHMVREKVHVLVFYVGQWTVLVSCDREAERHKLADLSFEIEAVLGKTLK